MKSLTITALTLYFSLAGSVVAQEPTSLSNKVAVIQPINLSAYAPPKPIRELLADLIAIGESEKAISLAAYTLPAESAEYSPYYYAVVALANYELGNLEEAEKSYSEALRLVSSELGISPLSPQVLKASILQYRTVGTTTTHDIGFAFYDHIDESQALEIINDALHERYYFYIQKAATFAIQIRGYASNPEFYLKRGIANIHLGNNEQAISDFQKAKLLTRSFGSMKKRRQLNGIVERLTFLNQ